MADETEDGSASFALENREGVAMERQEIVIPAEKFDRKLRCASRSGRISGRSQNLQEQKWKNRHVCRFH